MSGPHKFLRLLRQSALRAFYHNCFEVAKSAAYSSILSFFPGLAVVASLLFRHNVSAVMDEIAVALDRVLPPEVYRVASLYLAAQGRRNQGLLAGAWFVAIWSASNVMLSLIEGFRTAYRIPAGRSFFRGRAVALALLPLAGAPLLVASFLVLFGQQIENWLVAHLDEASWWVATAGHVVRWAIALGTSVVVIVLLYWVGPNRPQKLRYIWPGAALATVLWVAATLLFAWYVQHVARYGDLYGSVSTAVVLLIWMYIVSVIVILGCEFNAEYESMATEPERQKESSGL
jgi:membrane protein